MSEAKPQLGDLDLKLGELTWSEVISMAVQMGMDFAVLKKIDESTSPGIRVLTAMDSWLKSDPKASWKKVVTALKAIGKDVLAQKLEEEYCKAAPAAAPASVSVPPPAASCTRSDGAGSSTPSRPVVDPPPSSVATPQASKGIDTYIPAVGKYLEESHPL